MIKLFRHIRRNLLADHHAGKYLKYAIGEILLVVIGILIAVQINNWNEYRKDRIAEKELYITLIGSLESDLEDVRDKVGRIDSAIIAQEIFITKSYEAAISEYTKNEIGNLIWKVGYTSNSFFPNYSLYNKISANKQIDLIRSKELQMKVMELFEQHYKEYNDLDVSLEHQAQSSLISNFFGDVSHMYIKDDAIDIASLQKYYDELNKECRKIYFLSVSTKNSMYNCQNNIEELLELLKNEVKKQE